VSLFVVSPEIGDRDEVEVRQLGEAQKDLLLKVEVSLFVLSPEIELIFLLLQWQ
jgi:hypothetical protein